MEINKNFIIYIIYNIYNIYYKKYFPLFQKSLIIYYLIFKN